MGSILPGGIKSTVSKAVAAGTSRGRLMLPCAGSTLTVTNTEGCYLSLPPFHRSAVHSIGAPGLPTMMVSNDRVSSSPGLQFSGAAGRSRDSHPHPVPFVCLWSRYQCAYVPP